MHTHIHTYTQAQAHVVDLSSIGDVIHSCCRRCVILYDILSCAVVVTNLFLDLVDDAQTQQQRKGNAGNGREEATLILPAAPLRLRLARLGLVVWRDVFAPLLVVATVVATATVVVMLVVVVVVVVVMTIGVPAFIIIKIIAAGVIERVEGAATAACR